MYRKRTCIWHTAWGCHISSWNWICNNQQRCSIYRITGKECLKSYLLTPSSVKTILNLTANDTVTYEAFIKGQAFASTEYTAHPEKYSATEHSLNYVKKTRILKDDIVSFILEHCHELDSIDIVVGDEELKKNIMDRIRKATDEVYMTSSISQLLEISYKDAGKKSGVKFLQNTSVCPVKM